jgi:hypothetical protein
VQDLAGVASVSARLDAVLTRLSGRFRSMPESTLLRRLPNGRSRAAAGYQLAGLVAYAAQGVEDRGRDAAPAWRQLPYEGSFIVGDQIGVTGHDLLAACARAGIGEGAVVVWGPPGMAGVAGGPARIEVVLESVLAAAEELARVL